MTEPLKPYKVYIEEELLSGKSQQDVFNDVVSRYDIKIHDAAETIRKTPGIDKRNKCKKLNTVLIIALVVSMTLGLMYTLNDVNVNYVALFPSLINLMLLYGLINYKYPAHLLAGILLTILSFLLLILLVLQFDLRVLLELVFTLGATVLAWYLNGKLSSDYIYHREKVQDDPALRVDAVTFTK